MIINDQYFYELLRVAYEQGFHNGYCDSEEGLDNIICSHDWLSEVQADNEMAGMILVHKQ